MTSDLSLTVCPTCRSRVPNGTTCPKCGSLLSVLDRQPSFGQHDVQTTNYRKPIFLGVWLPQLERYFLSPLPVDDCRERLLTIMLDSLSVRPCPHRWALTWDDPTPFAVLYLTALPEPRPLDVTPIAISARCTPVVGGTLVGIRQRAARGEVWLMRVLGALWLTAVITISVPVLLFTSSQETRDNVIGIPIVALMVLLFCSTVFTGNLMIDYRQDTVGKAMRHVLAGVPVSANDVPRILAGLTTLVAS